MIHPMRTESAAMARSSSASWGRSTVYGMAFGQSQRRAFAEMGDLEALDRLLSASYPHGMQADYQPDVLAKALPLMTKANPVLVSGGTFFIWRSP